MMLTRVFLTLLCLNNLFLSISGSTLDTAVLESLFKKTEEKLRVQINATGDTIVLRFLRPQEAVKLEGYVLGYGGRMFSKQYIQLPKDGQPYYGEMDAEPKYLISVQPIKPNEVKKQCPGKLDLQKPLHLVIGSITPTKVMLTWGTLLKTPYSHDPDDCPQDGQYTIRYREQDTTVEPTPEPTPEPTQAPTSGPEPDRQWKYQTCPSSSTVIENLKPNTPYEFEVRANTDEGVGDWTPPIVHNTNASVTGKLVSLIENSNKEIEKPFKPPVMPKEPFLSRPILLNRTLGVMPLPRNASLPGNRRILDATPTWALPTAFTPVTIPPPQRHTHRNMTPPTTTSTTNQHGQAKQVVKTSVHKKGTKVHHKKTAAPGQHVSTPPKALPPRPDTQHLRTPNTPVRNKHLRHRNRRPHLDAKYQPKTSTPKLHGHQSPITSPSARPLPKITGPGYVRELSTSTGQKQPSQDHLKSDISEKSTDQQPRVPNQREELPVVLSPGDALAPTADASLPDMSKHTPITQRVFQTPAAVSPHTLTPQFPRTGAERQSLQSSSEGAPHTHTQVHTTFSEGTPHTHTQIHTTFSEGAPDTHTQVHTTLKHQPTGTQSTHNADETLLVGIATIADGSLDSQSPVSKDQDSQSPVSKAQDSQSSISKPQDSQSPVSEAQDSRSSINKTQDSQSPVSEAQDSRSSINKTQDSQSPVSKAQDSQSPISKDLRGLSVHPAHQDTERPAIFPNTDLSALENKTLISAPDEPITARQGLFPSSHSQPHPAAERLPTVDKQPIKITQRPSKKQPTKTTNPSTNGNQPGGKPNKKSRQQAVKVKQPSKPRQAPDEHGQEPIKHSQQTSQGGKQPIKTGHKPLYRKQKPQTTKEPIKTDQSVASTTDWLFTTGRPQDGHTQKNPSSPFSVTQYSLPTARPTLIATQPQQHTDRTRQETQSHTDTQHAQSTTQRIPTLTPSPVQMDLKDTSSTEKHTSKQRDNTPPVPSHIMKSTQSPTHSHTHTTMTTQSPSQGRAKPAYPQPTQSVSQVTPSSSRVLAPQFTTTKQQLRLLASGPSKDGQPPPSPMLVSEGPNNKRGRGDQRPRVRLPGPRPSVTTLLRTRRPFPAPAPVLNRPRPIHRNSTLSPRKTDVAVEGMQGVTLTKPAPKARNGSSVFKRPSRPLKNGLNQVVKPDKGPKQEEKGHVHIKQVDPEPVLKPTVPPAIRKSTSQPTTTTTTTTTSSTSSSSTSSPTTAAPTTAPASPTTPQAPRRVTQPPPRTTSFSYFNGNRFDSGENASIFSPLPTSEVDAMGKKRFTAPHVIYQTDKAPQEPCSITQTLSHFPEEEPTEVNVTAPPRLPPSNVTVVAVEGCPSFVIIDWEKSDNETTEYEVTSSTNEGKEVSILVTNKTHTAVENLKPESRYEFTVTPKNELGVGPTSEPVTFSTESADPRVAEVTGKRAIWSTFPFKLDMGSECNGPQYIKRTWYRKFVGIQLCNSLRYKIYLSDSLRGPFYHIGDQSGNGEDHCQFVDSFLDGRTGSSIPLNDLPETQGFYRAIRQEPVEFGTIGGNSHINYVSWYECGVAIPGKW